MKQKIKLQGFLGAVCALVTLSIFYYTTVLLNPFTRIENRLENIEKMLKIIIQNNSKTSHVVRSTLDLSYLADGCRYVFIDAGSNIGVQIRKLFEPEHFPCQATPCYTQIFAERFGPPGNRKSPAWGVCAFAFEANPVHTSTLKALETAYRKQGWRVTIFTETAVGDREGFAKLYRDSDERKGDRFYKPDKHPTSFSASTAYDLGLGYAEVVQVSLAEFIMKHIAFRSIPSPISAQAPPPAVVLKLDVEGSEYNILPNLELTGAICNLDVAYIEYHSQSDIQSNTNFHRRLSKRVEDSPNCSVQLVDGDDETYGLAEEQPPLPEK